MKKIAIILSGCGHKDGSEIRESILSMLAIEQEGFEFQCFAPNIDQTEVIDHVANTKIDQPRNILIESARIARGNIKSLDDLNIDSYDAILFPGGYGVAKNLTNFAYVNDSSYEILNDVSKIIKNCHKLKKLMCFLCIAPILIAKIIPNVKITLGNDDNLAKGMNSFSTSCVVINNNSPIIDHENKIISLPCYMLDVSMVDLFSGIKEAIREMKKFF